MNRTKNFEYPIFIRVIDFDKELNDIIESLNRLEYYGLKATCLKRGENVVPTDDDRMCLFIASHPSEELASIAKIFHDANVLTIGIFTENNIFGDGLTDSYTVVNADKVLMTVRSLIDPIFMPSIISVALSDIRNVLVDSNHFAIASGIGEGENRMTDVLNRATKGFSDQQLMSTDRLAIILFFKPDSTMPLTMKEASEFQKFITRLPDSTETMVWGVSHDYSLHYN